MEPSHTVPPMLTLTSPRVVPMPLEIETSDEKSTLSLRVRTPARIVAVSSDAQRSFLVVNHPPTGPTHLYTRAVSSLPPSVSFPSSKCPLCNQTVFPTTPPASSSPWPPTKPGPTLSAADDYWRVLASMHNSFASPLPALEAFPQASSAGLGSFASSLLNTGYYGRFFKECGQIGSGGFGNVYKAVHVLDTIRLGVYAVKKVPVGENRQWLLKVVREVSALERLHHVNIVDYKHSWLELHKEADFGPEVPYLFVLMQFATHGNLASFIWPNGPPAQCSVNSFGKRNAFWLHREAQKRKMKRLGVPVTDPPLEAGKQADGFLNEAQIWRFLVDISLGLHHLHEQGIVHRDLKPENLLLTRCDDPHSHSHFPASPLHAASTQTTPLKTQPAPPSPAFRPSAARVADLVEYSPRVPKANSIAALRVLISDFGQCLWREGDLVVKGTSAGEGNTGTLQYCAPEVLYPSAAGFEYTEASDLWSLGVILYAMAFSKLPFQSTTPHQLQTEIRTAAKEGIELPSTPERSPDLCSLIRSLLKPKVSQRAELRQVLACAVKCEQLWRCTVQPSVPAFDLAATQSGEVCESAEEEEIRRLQEELKTMKRRFAVERRERKRMQRMVDALTEKKGKRKANR